MKLHPASRCALALAVLALAAVPTSAGAQAFGLNEIGACAIARGFAVTSSPCNDASSIYWNPGAMPSHQGLSVSAGASIIQVNGDFTRDTTRRLYKADPPTSTVPAVFINYGHGDWGYGFGVYVPYGLTSEWGDDFPGRFEAKKASITTIYFQPNVSYKISPNWSVGGGPVIGHSSVELTQALDLSSQFAAPGVTFGNLGFAKYTEFGRATLDGSAVAFGVHLGFHGWLTPQWQIGGRFLSQLSFKYDDANATFVQTPTGLLLAAGNTLGPNGTSLPANTPVDALVAPEFTGTGALTAQKVTTQITHPAQMQVGLTYTGFKSTTLSADYAYTGWKSFRTLPVSFQGPAAANSLVLEEDYNNTSALRLGAQYLLTNGVGLRAGFAAAASAAPAETVTPLLPEMDRQLGMFGISVPFAHHYTFDASYAHIFTPGSRGRIDVRTTALTQAQALALTDGAYTLNANVWAFTFSYNH